MEKQIPKVLIDNDIHSLGLEGLAIFKPKTVQWGHRTITENVITMENRPPLHAARQELELERQTLWTLRKLIRADRIQYCNYWGIGWETARNQNSASYKVGIFDELHEKKLHLDALPPELMGQWSFQTDGGPAKAAEKFLSLNEESIETYLKLKSHEIPAYWISHLSNLPRLRKLASEQRHLADAMHLWVCELNNVKYFVSGEKSFKNYINKTLRIESSTRIVTPTELLQELDEPLVPFPIEKVKYALSIRDLDD